MGFVGAVAALAVGFVAVDATSVDIPDRRRTILNNSVKRGSEPIKLAEEA